MVLNHKKLTEKWQKEWKKARIFEPNVDKKLKPFYIQVAYPYPSGAMHIGHARTYTVTDIAARYHRMKGFNSLMPMGWHVSGTPVIATVEKLKEKDPATIKKMVENFKIPEKDLKLLETAESFVDYFVNKAKTGYKEGFRRLGLSIDWRRELTTVDPQYNKFIEWQYRKLYEKGYIIKGKYPVRYCPHDRNPVGDHDLIQGEGLGIQEFTLLKFKFEDKFIIAATLRPETVFGQTNLWVDPEIEYVEAQVDSEKWIASKEFFEKLKYQNKQVKVTGKIKGKELLGKMALAPGIDRKVIILPSYFCDPKIGSGIVTSVPSDAPDDFVALRDLQENEAECKKFGLDCEKIKKIEVIPIIKTKRFGDEAAVRIVEEMQIKSQREREKLEKAKKIVYKEGFHLGTMNENCGKYAGMLVSKAKDLVKKELLEKQQAELFYEMEGKAVCRCGTKVLVSVQDQWFVKYSDKQWKKDSSKTLKGMRIVPEFYRKQYEQVFDWLEDKPCTRSKGLGTKFPWEKTQIIEPLGDSTIYMAYFTVSHLIKQAPAEKLSDEVFDFIFLGKGKAKELAKKTGLEEKLLQEMRENFDYWYPLAFNTSAIELIPNHMAFSIFQHTAIFPANKRQKGTLNLGMLVVEGRKMASSLGNVKLVNDMTDLIGADMVRFFLMNSVEPWIEMDWKQRDVEQNLRVINSFLEELMNKAKKVSKAKKLSGKKLKNSACQWLVNAFNAKMNAATDFMDDFQIRKALQELTFKLIADLKWFEKRLPEKSAEKNSVYLYIIEDLLKALSPVMPHVCQEIWAEGLKKKGFIALEKWPEKKKVNQAIIENENYLKAVLSDIRNIMDFKKIKKPKLIALYTCPEWKWQALEKVFKACKEKPDFKKARQEVLKFPEAKKQDVGKVVNGLLKKCMELTEVVKVNEFKALAKEKKFLAKEFNCQIKVMPAKKAEFDPANKAKNAMPLKPAIYIE